MDYNQREFFLYRILSGVVKVKLKTKILEIYPPTRELFREACEFYNQKYDDYYYSGVFTNDQMMEQMIENDEWSYNKAKDIDTITETIKDFKISAYDNRFDKKKLLGIKRQIYSLENVVNDFNNQKNRYFHLTCEGMALKDKLLFIIKRCSYIDGKRIKLKNSLAYNNLIREYNNFHYLEEEVLRELARTDPWRLQWSIRKNSKKPLTFYPKLELTNNQKSLIAWSQTYDNVYQSIESPGQNVIDDDILLDGWFLKQSKERERKENISDIERTITNEKIKNSQEVYKVVGNNKELAKKVDSLNSIHSSIIKQQRENTLKNRGAVEDSNFADQKLNKEQGSNELYKNKIGLK
jgi:hypothetical protein